MLDERKSRTISSLLWHPFSRSSCVGNHMNYVDSWSSSLSRLSCYQITNFHSSTSSTSQSFRMGSRQRWLDPRRNNATVHPNPFTRWLKLVGDPIMEFIYLPPHLESVRQKHGLTGSEFNDYWRLTAACIVGDVDHAEAQKQLDIIQDKKAEHGQISHNRLNTSLRHEVLIQEADSALINNMNLSHAGHRENLFREIRARLKGLSSAIRRLTSESPPVLQIKMKQTLSGKSSKNQEEKTDVLASQQPGASDSVELNILRYKLKSFEDFLNIEQNAPMLDTLGGSASTKINMETRGYSESKVIPEPARTSAVQTISQMSRLGSEKRVSVAKRNASPIMGPNLVDKNSIKFLSAERMTPVSATRYIASGKDRTSFEDSSYKKKIDLDSSDISAILDWAIERNQTRRSRPIRDTAMPNYRSKEVADVAQTMSSTQAGAPFITQGPSRNTRIGLLESKNDYLAEKNFAEHKIGEFASSSQGAKEAENTNNSESSAPLDQVLDSSIESAQRLSNSLRLQVPQSGLILVDAAMTVDLNADVAGLQDQIIRMQIRLRSSFPRKDEMPFNIAESQNENTLRAWLKILVNRWQMRCAGQVAVDEQIPAEAIINHAKAVLDQMVRDHDLSNEAAERMLNRWSEISSKRGGMEGDAEGNLDWDALDAEGFSFLREESKDGQSSKSMASPVHDRQGKGHLHRQKFGFLNATRRNYASSSRSSANASAKSPRATGTSISLPHLTASGSSQMVSVSEKAHTFRTAIAVGTVLFSNATPLISIRNNALKKGDVLAVSRIAGIMAAKQCPYLVPLCHPIALSYVGVELYLIDHAKESPFGSVMIEAKVECTGPTGVEMEALTAVMGAALSVVDMCKAVDKFQRIQNARVVLKEGGKSGSWKEDNWISLSR